MLGSVIGVGLEAEVEPVLGVGHDSYAYLMLLQHRCTANYGLSARLLANMHYNQVCEAENTQNITTISS